MIALLLAACASAAVAAPTPKDQLLVPPADATHFVVVSTAGKHGDEYTWTTADGRIGVPPIDPAARPDLRDGRNDARRRRRHAIGRRHPRCYAERRCRRDFRDRKRQAHRGRARSTRAARPMRAPALLPHARRTVPEHRAAGRRGCSRPGRAGMALLPSGKASFDKVTSLDVDGPQGKKHVDLILMRGDQPNAAAVWVENGKFFGALVGLGLLPAGYEAQSGQDAGGPGCRDRGPGAGDRQEVPDRGCEAAGAVPQRQDVRRRSRALRRGSDTCSTADGKIVRRSAPLLPAKLPAGTRMIDGAGKTLVPGLVGQPHARRRRFPDGQRAGARRHLTAAIPAGRSSSKCRSASAAMPARCWRRNASIR